MRVKLRHPAAGPDWCKDPGDIVDFPREQALELIRSGQADPYDPMPAERTDVNPRGETAEVKVALGRRVP